MRKFIAVLGVVFLFSLVLVPVVSASVIASDTTSPSSFTYWQIHKLHPDLTGSGTSGVFQSFTSNATEYAANITLQLKKTGTPTGLLTVTLCTIQGTYGSSSVPLVDIEVSDSLNASVVQGSFLPFTFNFSATTELVNASVYGFYISGSSLGFSTSNYVWVGSSNIGSSGNGARYMSSAWTAFSTYDVVYVLNGELTEGSPTPTPTASPSSGDGDGTLEYWSGKLMPWLAYAVILLIPAFLGLKFLGQMGFIVGLNIGALLLYLVFPDMLWIMLVFGILDLMVVFYLRG